MTIAQAAKAVLEEAGQPLDTREILKRIKAKQLYTFQAKDPVSVLGSAMRRRSQSAKGLRGEALFERRPDGTYALL